MGTNLCVIVNCEDWRMANGWFIMWPSLQEAALFIAA